MPNVLQQETLAEQDDVDRARPPAALATPRGLAGRWCAIPSLQPDRPRPLAESAHLSPSICVPPSADAPTEADASVGGDASAPIAPRIAVQASPGAGVGGSRRSRGKSWRAHRPRLARTASRAERQRKPNGSAAPIASLSLATSSTSRHTSRRRCTAAVVPVCLFVCMLVLRACDVRVHVCRVRAYTDATGGRHTKAALAAVCGLGRHGHGTSADGTPVTHTKHTCHTTYTCHTYNMARGILVQAWHVGIQHGMWHATIQRHAACNIQHDKWCAACNMARGATYNMARGRRCSWRTTRRSRRSAFRRGR